MIKIFKTEETVELDKYTIAHEPISGVALVERAATAFIHAFCRHYPTVRGTIYVFAGCGNNGADALAAARLLCDAGYCPEVYLFDPKRNLSPECEANKNLLLGRREICFREIVDRFIPPAIRPCDIVIDGLFGSGLNRPLGGEFAAAADCINRSCATVVSIDIPSGLFGEDNRNNNPAHIIKADLACTFEFPKLAFMFAENEPFVKQWTILPIGIHPDIVAKTATPYSLVTPEDVKHTIRRRPKFSHKGTFGHALLIAGGKGKMGAAVLASGACMRSGVGRLTVHIPQRGETILQTAVPEAMLSLDENADFVSALPAADSYDAVGVGPGIGTHHISAGALESLLKSATKPLVLDADALNILAANRRLIKLLPPHTILTPHPREFDRLYGESAAHSYDRLHRAMKTAETYAVYIVLKGARTAVCTPEGNVCFNSTGNAGMATAGSGDVLTGLILGLLAQGYAPETAAVAGVYLHGLAGDIAAADLSEESLIAGDIIRALGKAFGLQHHET
ncbi:MAG: NAD(P)H-hydrate dehydratase [Tannerella sp.]|jgi:NAD(P)H-hydrate epimerase|nr:NAD(P)H-hydrate dehydratase [Tannerella sp.]